MSAALIAQYQHVYDIYAKASLLEANLAPDALAKPLTLKDAQQLDLLNGNKGNKLARRWAPLIVHRALHLTKRELSKEMLETLEKTEASFDQSTAETWKSCFKEAAALGLPMTGLFKQKPTEYKKRLFAERKAWRELSEKIDTQFAKLLTDDVEWVKSLFEKGDQEGTRVSLKKLSKFKPTAH